MVGERGFEPPTPGPEVRSLVCNSLVWLRLRISDVSSNAPLRPHPKLAFAFAGIWDRWKDATGKAIETCSILTTTANAVTSAVHDRMPVILDPDSYDLWLDPGMRAAGRGVRSAEALRRPADAVLSRERPDQPRG